MKIIIPVQPPSIRYFETVKRVLDRSLAVVCAKRGLSEEAAKDLLVKHLQSMSREWFTGRTPNIAYEDPMCRLAYLYCHVPVNANLFEVVIRSTPDLSRFISERLEAEGELKVCSFGGGPGTEVLGLSKHLWKNKKAGQQCGTISFTVLDRVTEWAESWNALEKGIRDFLKTNCGAFKDWPFSIGKSFNTFDLTDCTRFANLAELFGQDLFVMNYVISELYGDTDKFLDVLAAMVESAPKGSKFLIIDRQQESIMEKATNLLKETGLKTSATTTNIGSMDIDEQVTALEPYVTLIGRKPRVRWGNRQTRCGAFWIIGTKK